MSWRTILAKRENFRVAFSNFDFNKVAKYGEEDIERLIQDKGIVRHRGKIEAVINNAKCALELVKEEGSIAAFVWSFEPDNNSQVEPQSASTSKESVALAIALKKKGWKFLEPTTVYTFMQAMGLINDHVNGCFIRNHIEKARIKFKRTSKRS